MTAAIRVHRVSKRYQLGEARGPYRTFRESVTTALTAPFRRGRHRAATQATEMWALKDVSFDVGTGEVIGVVGRNGAGKSTLLKTLSRIISPTEGEIRLRGR